MNRQYDEKVFAEWLLTNLPGCLDIRREDEPSHLFSELDVEESKTPYGINLRELTSRELFPQFSNHFHKFLARYRINTGLYDSFVGVPLGATGLADLLSAEHRMDVIVAKMKATQPDSTQSQNSRDYFEQEVRGKYIIPIEDVPYTGHKLDNLVTNLRKCGTLTDLVVALIERKDKCYETRIGNHAFRNESGLTMVAKKHEVRPVYMLGIETLFEVAQELHMPQLDDSAKRIINDYLEKNSLTDFRFNV